MEADHPEKHMFYICGGALQFGGHCVGAKVGDTHILENSKSQQNSIVQYQIFLLPNLLVKGRGKWSS